MDMEAGREEWRGGCAGEGGGAERGAKGASEGEVVISPPSLSLSCMLRADMSISSNSENLIVDSGYFIAHERGFYRVLHVSLERLSVVGEHVLHFGKDGKGNELPNGKIRHLHAFFPRGKEPVALGTHQHAKPFADRLPIQSSKRFGARNVRHRL